MFTRDTGGLWTEDQRLTPAAVPGCANDPAVAGCNNQFGRSVALSGDGAVVGGSSVFSHVTLLARDSGSGVWSILADLSASDGNAFDFFGTNGLFSGPVAVSGGRIVVGTQFQPVNFFNNPRFGAAYVFEAESSNEPPEITVNSPYVLEGNTIGGYDNSGGLVASAAGVSATDAEDGVLTDLDLTNDAPGFLPLGDTTVTWTATDSEDLTNEGDQTVTDQDTTAPNITVPLDITEEITSPTGNVIVFATSTSDIVDASPTVSCTSNSGDTFPLGTTTVDCVATDASDNENPSSFDVTIEDTTPPTVQSNAPETIVPPDAPISFTATATDNGTANPVVTITSFECWAINGAGKRIDKSESCVVSIDGATITILDSGGVGTHIDWTVTASDGSDDTTEDFEVEVVNPGRGRPARP